jgi:tight adherence protein B
MYLMSFGLAVFTLGFLYRYYYQTQYYKKRHALLLVRLEDEDREGEVGQKYLGFGLGKISTKVWLQKLLVGTPGIEYLATLLENSGLPHTVEYVLLRILGLWAGSFVLFIFIGIVVPLAFLTSCGIAYTPVLYITWLRDRRLWQCEEQLTTALDCLVLYLRSGRSFPQALKSSVDDLPQPIAGEFALCSERYELGRPIGVVLDQLADRVPHAVGFRMLATTIMIVGQTGGNLVEILESIHRSLVIKMKYQMRLRSATSESRGSSTIIAAAPGVFMLITLFTNPAHINIFFQVPAGQKVFVLFLILWCTGIFWIQKLMSMDLD